MQIQRPPRCQVFCRSASVWSIHQALPVLTSGVFIIHVLSNLNVSWQRPSGTAIRSEAWVQHLLSIFTTIRKSYYSCEGISQAGSSNPWFIRWHVFGASPKKHATDVSFRGTPNFQIFSKLKKSKFLNCDFWPGNCSKWPNLDPGGIKNTFWVEEKFFKFFHFWT